MSAFVFGVRLSADDAGLRVSSRDLPGLVTWGANEQEALAEAEDALDSVIADAIDRDIELPAPTPVRKGEFAVSPSAHIAAKLAVWRAFRDAGISKSDLAKRLGVGENEARRILDPYHGTKLERLDAAARALGKRLTVGLAA
jgi:antitoxin HicB